MNVVRLELRRRMSTLYRHLVALTAGLLLVAAFVPPGAEAAARIGGPCPAWVSAATALQPAQAGSKASAPAGTRVAAGAVARSAHATPALAYEPKGVSAGPTKLLVKATVSPGTGTLAVVQYGRGSTLTTCSAVQRIATGSVSSPVRLLLAGLRPGTAYRFRIVAKTAAGPAVGGERTFSTLAGGHVPQGVEVGQVPLGGMSRIDARAALLRPIASPLRLSYAGAYWQASRIKAGATIDVRRALNAALTASPEAQLPPIGVSVDRGRLQAFVSTLSRRWSRQAATADVRLVGKHAVVTASESGIAVDTRTMDARIGRELASGAKGVVPLAVTKTEAAPPAGAPQKSVVIRLGAQTLTAYLNGKQVLETPVTTGRAVLPTPIGSYTIHYRASPYTFISPWPPGSPYYYPPARVTWAMYFFDNDFLHDDPAEPTSAFGAGSEDGPYASHGCVHVPYNTMAFLYNWLPVGAPVIVSQT